MTSRCFSAGGVTVTSGTINDPLIDQPTPSTVRPKGMLAAALAELVSARADAAPTGTWLTIHGIIAAVSKTAEWVANRGAAYFSDSPPYPLPNCRLSAAYTSQTRRPESALQANAEMGHGRDMTVTGAA